MNAAPSIFSELKRRNVPRAGVLYAGAVWALAQGIAQLGPFFGAPEWTVRWFVIAAAIGFPFWLVFAWLFEFTTHGLRREDELPADPAREHSTARKMDFAIIAVLAIAVVLLLTNTFVWHAGAGLRPQAVDASAVLAKVPAKSVAVLPLANKSGDPKQDYFVDGLSEELVSDLTQVDQLKVIGSGSSFQFRDSKESPAQIGAKLGVAHLLEGSVRTQGDRVRITMNLIRASDGSDLWSQIYERDLKDIFKVQSDIAHAVAAALKVELGGQSIFLDDKPPSGNILAYQAYLQSTAAAGQGGQDTYEKRIALLEKAIAIDPAYARAYCTLSEYLINLAADYLQGDARAQAYSKARSAVDKALVLAPDHPDTHIAHAYILANIDLDQTGALAEYERAYALAPNKSATISFLANQLAVVGQLQRSISLWHKALAKDPLRVDWYAAMATALTGLGRLDEAEQVFRNAIALQPDHPGLYADLSIIDVLRGNATAAVHDAKLETDPASAALALAQAAQISGDRKRADAALHAYIAGQGKAQPYQVAELYAARNDPTAMFEWLERARVQQDPNLVSLLDDALILRYKDDPRFAAFCRKMGLPTPAGTKAVP